ncbi:biotin/lipoyl-binding protein [Nocardioides sp. CER19]|uniref:efflux RND transporter periplasmic adaptor subunit n=1 Tax=Nocardioides sp. CER19 TaxID=3038538 RepID=UPI00244B2FB8|nr:biotin/lipoyl-binding protein [Nocardioides sp. CER19]MDH2416798.1 efflux RND transporter periplasmic adaptor subunit [Nocardioides sp. CER19]
MRWRLLKKRRRGRTWWLVTAVALVVVAGSGGWLLFRSDDGAAATAATTAQVSSTTIQQTVSASGTVAAAKTADLDFGVSGRVTHVWVAAGDKVKKGQRLAEVDATALEAARTAAQSTLDAARAQLSEDEDANASDVQVAADQTSVVSAQASLDEAEQAVDDAVLRSTISGTVTSVGLEVGDTVGSGSSGGSSNGSAGGSSGGLGSASSSASTSTSSTTAVTVVSNGTYVVDATVASSDVAQVKKGLQANITVTGVNDTVYGTVQSVGLVAETNSSGAAVFPVTIAVTGQRNDLFAGTSATASIVVKQTPDVLVVPSRALKSSGDTTYVLKMVSGKATRTTVEVGQTYGAQTQVLSGLKSGDTVQVPGFTLPSGAGTRSNRSNRTGSNQQEGGFPGGQGAFPGGGFPGGGAGGGFPQ